MPGIGDRRHVLGLEVVLLQDGQAVGRVGERPVVEQVEFVVVESSDAVVDQLAHVRDLRRCVECAEEVVVDQRGIALDQRVVFLDGEDAVVDERPVAGDRQPERVVQSDVMALDEQHASVADRALDQHVAVDVDRNVTDAEGPAGLDGRVAVDPGAAHVDAESAREIE